LGEYVVEAYKPKPDPVIKQDPGVRLMADQKYLRNKNTGVVFIHTDALALHPDMEPYEGDAKKENKRVAEDATANEGTLPKAGEENLTEASADKPFADMPEEEPTKTRRTRKASSKKSK
jgi:hypothetical protein